MYFLHLDLYLFCQFPKTSYYWSRSCEAQTNASLLENNTFVTLLY